MTKLVARGSAWIEDNGNLAPRSEWDFYPTSEETVQSAFEFLLEECPQYSRQRAERLAILDPGCADGVWGRVAKRILKNPLVDGVEIQDRFGKPEGYSRWANCDFHEFAKTVNDEWNLIVGNPPYRHAEQFVRTSLELLEPGGHLLFLLRLAFLEGQARGTGLWREFPPQSIGVCSKRPSFTGNGRTDALAYMIVLWQKGFTGEPRLRWIGNRN